MKIKHRSHFKDVVNDVTWFKNWVSRLETSNGRTYEYIEVNTSLGKTQVWGLNTKAVNAETLVIFPGARTTTLFWDFNRGLDNLNQTLRLFLVETNGLPNLSDGSTPDIKSNGYGLWAAEVFNALSIEKAFVAGASFGGLICMKLAIVKPEKVKAAFLLNAGCLLPFSLSMSNLYYNILPIIAPSEKNVRKFLDKAIFSKPNHAISATAEQLLIDYELFAIKQYKDRTQKPYYMDKELDAVKTDTYVQEGDKDLLFPYRKSIANAKKHISTLCDVKVFNDVGHGIETYREAIAYIGDKIESYAGG